MQYLLKRNEENLWGLGMIVTHKNVFLYTLSACCGETLSHQESTSTTILGSSYKCCGCWGRVVLKDFIDSGGHRLQASILANFLEAPELEQWISWYTGIDADEVEVTWES